MEEKTRLKTNQKGEIKKAFEAVFAEYEFD